MPPRISTRERLPTTISHQEPNLVSNAPKTHAYLLEYYGSSSWMALLLSSLNFCKKILTLSA